jgi:hypothetical protein
MLDAPREIAMPPAAPTLLNTKLFTTALCIITVNTLFAFVAVVHTSLVHPPQRVGSIAAVVQVEWDVSFSVEVVAIIKCCQELRTRLPTGRPEEGWLRFVAIQWVQWNQSTHRCKEARRVKIFEVFCCGGVGAGILPWIQLSGDGTMRHGEL